MNAGESKIAYEFDEVKSRLISALFALWEKDRHLLKYDASERSITHRLAVHLEGLFPEYDVDCEYNRNSLHTRGDGNSLTKT